MGREDAHCGRRCTLRRAVGAYSRSPLVWRRCDPGWLLLLTLPSSIRWTCPDPQTPPSQSRLRLHPSEGPPPLHPPSGQHQLEQPPQQPAGLLLQGQSRGAPQQPRLQRPLQSLRGRPRAPPQLGVGSLFQLQPQRAPEPSPLGPRQPLPHPPSPWALPPQRRRRLAVPSRRRGQRSRRLSPPPPLPSLGGPLPLLPLLLLLLLLLRHRPPSPRGPREAAALHPRRQRGPGVGNRLGPPRSVLWYREHCGYCLVLLTVRYQRGLSFLNLFLLLKCVLA